MAFRMKQASLGVGNPLTSPSLIGVTGLDHSGSEDLRHA